MRQAEFAELSREVMPVLDKLTEIAGQHGTAEKLVNGIACRLFCMRHTSWCAGLHRLPDLISSAQMVLK